MKNLKLALLNSRDKRLAASLREAARELVEEFSMARGARADIIIVNDAAIAGLNRRWRRRDRPTDVLSFPADFTDPETGRRVLGEIYVSRERAREQGRKYGTGYYGELKRLITHGLLHLLGLSHREMASRERRLDSQTG